MPPPRYRDLSKGSVLEATYTDALEDFLSGREDRNFNVVIATPTSLQVTAGGDIGSVAVSINGEWRHIEASQTRSHPGGAAGTYDVYLVGSANSFATGAPDVGEIDNTFYGFELRIVPAGSSAPTGTLTGGQTIAITRRVRTVHWDGAAITRVDRLSPEMPGLHAASHAPGGSDPMPVDQGAGVASLRTLGTAPTQAAAGNDARFADSRTPTGAAGGDLTGTYPNPTIKADVGLTGLPTAPTPAQDTGGTRIATAGYYLAQKGTATPAMNGTAAAGSSPRWAPIDHVHPIDTSRAPLDSPAFTGTPSASTLTLTAAATPMLTLQTTGQMGLSAYSGAALPDAPMFRFGDGTGWNVGFGPATGASAGVRRVKILDTGYVDALAGFRVNGTALAASHLSNGTTGAGAVVLASALPAASAVAPAMDGTAAAGASGNYARADHVHPSDTSRAPLANPSFTGTVSIGARQIWDTGSTLQLNSPVIANGNFHAFGYVVGDSYLMSGGLLYLGGNTDTYIERQAASVMRSSGGFFAGGSGSPSAGAHVEVQSFGGNGVIQAFDRSGGIFRPLTVAGSTLALRAGSDPSRQLYIDSTGFAFLGRESSYGTGNVAYGVSVAGGGTTQMPSGVNTTGITQVDTAIEVLRSLLRTLHKKGIISINDFVP